MPDDHETEGAEKKQQASKQKSADQTAQEKKAAEGGKPPAEEAVETPKAEFAVIVSSIATQALVSLGKIKNPLTDKKQVDLRSAKFSVDLLQVLADKTRGNPTESEERYLQGVLYQLRMAYVEAAK